MKRDDGVKDSGDGKMACSVTVTVRARPFMKDNKHNRYSHFNITLKSTRPENAGTHACNVSDHHDSINMMYEQNGIGNYEL